MANREPKVTGRVTRTFSNAVTGDITVTAELSNTRSGFQWRLVSGPLCTSWVHFYSGILTIEVEGRIFGYATSYWEGDLPTEEPFEVVKGRK